MFILSQIILFIKCVMFLQGTFFTDESSDGMSPSASTYNDEVDESVHAFWHDNKENNNGNAPNFGHFYAQQNLAKASVVLGVKRYPFDDIGYEVIENSLQQYSSGSINGYSQTSSLNEELSCSLPMSSWH